MTFEEIIAEYAHDKRIDPAAVKAKPELEAFWKWIRDNGYLATELY